MTKKDFLAGKAFSYDMDKDGVYMYDGKYIRKKEGNNFEIYCKVDEVLTYGFEATFLAFGHSSRYIITFKRCENEG